MVMAAVDGHSGNPHDYRDYKLREIMKEQQFLPDVKQGEAASMVG
jgi:hypothetical protein